MKKLLAGIVLVVALGSYGDNLSASPAVVASPCTPSGYNWLPAIGVNAYGFYIYAVWGKDTSCIR